MRLITVTRAIGGMLPLAALASSLGAQTPRAERRTRDDGGMRVFSFDRDDSDRPRLGIMTGSGGLRDTLGLLVSSVTPGSPADKAGIAEGDRIASIDGVNLRLSREDAEEGDMDGVSVRRLTRELGKKKVGDDVELRLWSDGRSKTVKVKTVSGSELSDLGRDRRRTSTEIRERAVLGVSLSSTGSRRDTLGLMVMRVTTDGPADKAGIVEGDRIASINGVDLRTPKEDLDDGYFGGSRMGRLNRELRKLEVGKDVELRIYSGRESHSVRVRPVKASDLARGERGRHGSFFMYGDGDEFDADMAFPFPPGPPFPPGAFHIGPIGPIGPVGPIGPRDFEFDGGLRGLRDLDAMGLDGGFRIRVNPQLEWDIEDRVRDAMDRVGEVRRRVQERVVPAVRRAIARVTI